ncbi:beta/gamma crystallin-related protein [Chroococcidiopsis thermalis]|uniref:Beta/gamma crystallin 'Greek key' domain-containing protein n=1 Tax=Chroococcidiopsis thermalis (strain PCC 7203) TaxID=251229 RepID=K9U4L2_CHRTP|nr:beta/gamma crystallin-related protein [Chroococcidiopsis thermalis]AFY89184.1 hypothetical protein Chro_3749 [Chroococcidiopsis thermalis PCC 7203]PSB42797.1 hypothetical protein C7B80_26330 [Cyanosarcina cf. burmensis CCALA 770]
MLNTKEYFNQLDTTLAVQELDNETSAAIQGGYNLQLFDDYDAKTGLLGSFNKGGKANLIADNKISSIKIKGGQWRFYEHPNFNQGKPGYELTLGKGTWHLRGNALNNQISSFQKVG